MKRLNILVVTLFVFEFMAAGFTQTWTIYAPENSGIPSNDVQQIDIDEMGNKWLAMGEGGLVKFDGDAFKIFVPDTNEYFKTTRVLAVSSSEIWGNYSYGVYHFDGVNWTLYSRYDHDLPAGVNGIQKAANGDIWVSTASDGAAVFHDSVWQTFNKTNSGISTNDLLDVAIDQNGVKWFGSRYKGLIKYDDVNWDIYTTDSCSIPSNWVNAVTVDKNNAIWVGTAWDGIAKFDGVNWEVFNTDNSLIPGNRTAGKALDFDMAGTLWFGAWGAGLGKFDGTTWMSYTTDNSGLPNSKLRDVKPEGPNVRWIGMEYESGLVKMEDELDLVFQPLNDMPYPKFGLGYTASNSYLYAASGGPGDERSQKIERYKISTGTWSELISGVKARRYCSAEFVNAQNKIYLFNGDTYPNHTNTDTIDVIDLADGSHTILTSNPYPVHYGGSAVWNDKIYVFGGNNGDGYSNRLYEFDPATDNWTRLADMPEAKQTSGKIIDGVLYVFGGYNGSVSSRIDAYNISGESWSYLGDMPSGLSSHATAVSGKYIWLVGDYSDLSFIAVYNTETNEFKKLTSNMAPRRHAAAVAKDNKLYVYGGYNGQDVLSSLEVADISSYVTGMNLSDNDGGIRDFYLEQNYPNPFNPSTTISYSLPEQAHVTIEIYNLLGERVDIILNKMQTSGFHKVLYHAENLSSGIYFYTVRAKIYYATRKMIIIR